MDAKKPKVSAICTCYNKERWIRQALDSIANQKAGFPFEVIVIDDASTDGSPSVIESFREEHPDITRVILHGKNQGIASTWLEACELADGDYIARLDGDDYWTDEFKLEAQVSALEESDDARWCSTDFDMVDAEGAAIHSSVLASGMITKVDSYEQMLAIKGLTNSSTWLVDSQLMREANEGLEPGVADDTFSLQLEMFRKTRLLRIEKPMCAMRVSQGSDSRPLTRDDIEVRFKGLKDQQVKYLDKYEDADFKAAVQYCVERDVDLEVRIFELEGFERELQNCVVDLRNTIELRDQEIAELMKAPRIMRLMRRAFRAVARRVQKR